MLKKFFALTSAVTVLASAAYAGESCCAAKSTSAKSASTEVKSCCAAKAKPASGTKSAMACCAKDAKATTKAAKNTKATKTKLTQVNVCPMMGAPVHGTSGGSQKVGAYNVNFCCAGCKPAFNKLSKAEQQKKIQEALKKQHAAKKVA